MRDTQKPFGRQQTFSKLSKLRRKHVRAWDRGVINRFATVKKKEKESGNRKAEGVQKKITIAKLSDGQVRARNVSSRANSYAAYSET